MENLFFFCVVFKWGSLVGLSLPSSGANNTSPFVTTDIAFKPLEFTTKITTWNAVPWCTTDFSDYDNTATDHLATIIYPAAGIGDICRYMGIVDGSTWRIPTQSEWNELYGSDEPDKGQAVKLGNGWIQGNYYPLSGYAMGPNRNNVTITGNGSNTQIINADPYDDGAVFLTASGYRNTSVGAIYSIGSQGRYWSATASAIDRGYYMYFNSSSVWPQHSDTRTFAFSVRCIRE